MIFREGQIVVRGEINLKFQKRDFATYYYWKLLETIL